jgi:hypothetical protein
VAYEETASLAAATASSAADRSALERKQLSELKQLAIAAGVDGVDRVDGADNPRATLVEVLLALSAAQMDEFGKSVREEQDEISLPCHPSFDEESWLGRA